MSKIEYRKTRWTQKPTTINFQFSIAQCKRERQTANLTQNNTAVYYICSTTQDNLHKPAPEKAKPFWILLEQEMMGWQWHQLDHIKIIYSLLQTDNHASTSPFSFYRPDALAATQPTASKHWRHKTTLYCVTIIRTRQPFYSHYTGQPVLSGTPS